MESEYVAGISGEVISWIGLQIGVAGTRSWDSESDSSYTNLTGKL